MATVKLNDATIQVSLGKAGELPVDVAKLMEHPQVVEYVFHYGLKQMLNDVHAAEKDPAKKVALSQKKLDSLYEGEVAQQRASADPVGREMRAMAEGDLKAKLKALGKKVSDYDAKVWRAVVAKQVEANADAYRKAAEAKLAIKPKDVEAADDILAMLDETGKAK